MSRGHIQAAADQVRQTAALAESMLEELRNGQLWRLIASKKSGLKGQVATIRRNLGHVTAAKSAESNEEG